MLAAIPVLAFALCSTCVGQDASYEVRREPVRRASGVIDTSAAALAPTPEMWFYEQERKRHDDPKLSVRARAELQASQRRERLASSKWYGIYNSRPTVSPTPWFTSYSDHWGSNSYDPQRWRMPASPVVVFRPNVDRY
jgi:hypothetical protein